MATDWALVRQMTSAAIDACARIEAAGFTEAHRAVPLPGNPAGASVQDALVSGWTYPEAMRTRILLARHAAGADRPYVPEAARILIAMAEAAAELIGAGAARPAEAEIRAMISWYGDMATTVEQAIAAAELPPAQ